VISCKHSSRPPREILRFVNDQNDGWNAFPIALRDDSTFEIEHLSFGEPDVERGRYSISSEGILLFRGDSSHERIIFEVTPSGHILKPTYISDKRTIAMRVVFDSLFSDHKHSNPY